MMKRIFRFAAKPDVYVDSTWGDPDRLPENSQSPDSAPVPAAQLLDHPLELRLLILIGVPIAILLAVCAASALFGGICLALLSL